MWVVEVYQDGGGNSHLMEGVMIVINGIFGFIFQRLDSFIFGNAVELI